jgi:hypothetical protein
MIMTLLYWALVKGVYQTYYTEQKKHMKDNPALVNALTELTYKATERAFDYYQGPLTMIEFFGNNMNPPIYQVPVKTITSASRVVFGDKPFMDFV